MRFWRHEMERCRYDIVCVGGGLAGIALSVECAKSGRRALIIERNEFLGGCAVSGFSVKGLFSKDGRRSESWFIDLFLRRMEEREGIRKADAKVPFYVVNSEITKFVCYDICREFGVEILFHSTIGSVNVRDGRLVSCTAYGKGSSIEIEAPCFVDTTGTGELASMVGVPSTGGDSNRASFSFTICNYKDSVLNEGLLEGVFMMPSAEKGRMLVSLPGMELGEINPRNIGKVMYDYSCQTMDFIHHVRENLAGFEHCKVSTVPASLNIRSGRRFSMSEDSRPLSGVFNEEGTLCMIAKGDVLPRDIRGLLVCGKALGPACTEVGSAAIVAESLGKNIGDYV